MLNEEDKELIEKIVERIKYLRDKRNVSQLDVYFETELNIARIERAKGDIKISSIRRLCKYFNITLEEFFNDIK